MRPACVIAVTGRGAGRRRAAIRDGQIVAVKGLGGFHLIVDADDDGAVRRLRERSTARRSRSR